MYTLGYLIYTYVSIWHITSSINLFMTIFIMHDINEINIFEQFWESL